MEERIMERTIFKAGNRHAVALPAEMIQAYGLYNGSRACYGLWEPFGTLGA